MSQPSLEDVPGADDESTPGSPLAGRLIELARQVAGREKFVPRTAVIAALRLVVELAPGVRWATFIGSGVRDEPFSFASISAVGATLDHLQCRHGEGPSLDALASRVVVVAGDLTKEHRWPGFTASAAGTTPARTVISYPLACTGRPDITLNLYSDDPAALISQQPAILTAAAGIGFVMAAIDVRVRADNLASAMVSNREIGAAVGILMVRHDWTPDRAFATIRKVSQRQHRKVREVAAVIVKTGQLPSESTGHP